MHLPFDLILTKLWHLLDVSAMTGHGAVQSFQHFIQFLSDSLTFTH